MHTPRLLNFACRNTLFLSVIALMLFSCPLFAQPKPVKNAAKQSPTQAQMQQMLEEAMNQEGMSAAEKAEMKKMIKGGMPAMAENTVDLADYPDVADNALLFGRKDAARTALATRRLTQAGSTPYVADLFSKIMDRAPLAEVSLLRKLSGNISRGPELASASVLAAMQGHPEVAMGLMAKASQTEPSNTNWTNNLGALLTQYGYPEQALPLLNLVNQQAPANSTVLSNLSYAWMGLGQPDSTRKYAAMASRRNPAQPDAKAAGGIAESKGGDPVRGVRELEEAMVNNPNAVIEKLIANAKGDPDAPIDFEKLKSAISIYEYFPRLWIDVPKLSNTVGGYDQDKAVADGFQEMTVALNAKVKGLLDQALEDVQALASKGPDEFNTSMVSEITGGFNMMSKTAVVIRRILIGYQQQWQERYTGEANALHSQVADAKSLLDAFIAKGKWTRDNCHIADTHMNDFMQTWNPVLYRFHMNKANEFREWLNAYVTWNWYVAGNVRNTVIAEDIGWVSGVLAMYTAAMGAQYRMMSPCRSEVSGTVQPFPEPAIPDFTCPVVVSLPAGKNWQQLSNESKNLDANSYDIRRGSQPSPNMNVAYATSGAGIAEAGVAPYASVQAGSLMLAAVNPGPSDVVNKPAPFHTPDIQAHAWLAKALLRQGMTPVCDVNKYRPFKPDLEKVRQLDETAETDEKRTEQLKRLKKALGDSIKEYEQGGLQPSISSSPQAPGTFKANPGLFK